MIRIKRSNIKKKFKKSEAGMSLIAVIFAILLMAAIGATMAPLLSNRALGSVEDLQGQQAFYVADGGLQYILEHEFKNAADFSTQFSPTGTPFGGTSIALGAGQFWAEYSNKTTSTVDIKVTGKVGNSVRIVQQSAARVGGGSGSDACSGGNVQLTGRGTANGNLLADGNVQVVSPFTVNGTVTSNTNVPCAPVGVNAGGIISGLAATPGCTTISGNWTPPGTSFSGCVNVTGNVQLIIPTNYTITGTIISQGNIQINGTLTLTGTLASQGNIQGTNMGNSVYDIQTGQTTPVLVAQGNIQLTAGSNVAPEITGQMISNGNIQITKSGNGAFDITGQLTAGGNIQITKNGTGNFTVNGGLVANGNFQGTGPGSGGNLILNLGGGSLDLTNWKEA